MDKWLVKIFNFNKKKLEKEEIIFYDGDRLKHTFDYWKFMMIYFKDYKVIDNQGKKYGVPDFLLKKGKEDIYLELKFENDGININQFEWMCKNKRKQIRIMYIKWQRNTR